MRRWMAGWPLLLTFGVSSLLAVAAVAAVLQYALRGMVEERAISQAVRAAEFAAHVGLEPLLPEDAAGRVLDDASRRAVDQAVASGLDHGVLARLKVMDRDGLILYSDNPEILGDRYPPSPVLRGVIATGTAGYKFADIAATEHAGERRHGQLMEVFVPLRSAGGGPVSVVAELYVPFDPVRESVREDVGQLLALLCGGLAFLWLVLFRLVQLASARLRRELRRNEHQALHDALTGLPNRTLLFDRAERALAAAAGGRGAVAVLLLDLDRFKEVNDTLGHHNGDRLLLEVAHRLSERLRDCDTLARLGGDEFAVLLPQVEGPEEAEEVAHRLAAALRQPVVLDGLTLSVGASIGVAVHPEDGTTREVLLQRADVAMYAAKRGHLVVARYAPESDEYSPERLTLLGELRDALERGELALHFQPKADPRTGGVTGFEALLRWHHRERGMIQPDEFVPLAEHTGLIDEITPFVVERALAQCAAWTAAGHPLPVSVNVSVRNLVDPRFPARVAELLAGSGVPACRLVLELTESAFMSDPDTALLVLHELKALGVGLSVDDYGSGYSSLAYLQQLPVDELKIDRRFVQELPLSAKDQAIVRSTIDLGKNLGLSVVAEGVEDQASWELLAAGGCDAVQGWFLGRPMPAGEVVGWLRHHREDRDAAPTAVAEAAPAGA